MVVVQIVSLITEDTVLFIVIIKILPALAVGSLKKTYVSIRTQIISTGATCTLFPDGDIAQAICVHMKSTLITVIV